MGCPLCGELTYKASTRLVRDTCGHIKCRMCLLKEENGCKVCEAELRIDSIGSFNYLLPSFKPRNYEFSTCKPLELTINKIPVNLDLSQSIEKEITVDENNLQSQNNDIATETNENIQHQQREVSTAEHQNIDKQIASTSQIIKLVESTNSNDSNDLQHLNNDSALAINKEREKNIADAQNKNLSNQNNLQNNNEENENHQIVYQISSIISSRLTENSDQTLPANSRVETFSSSHRVNLVLQKSFSSIGSPSRLEESEMLNSEMYRTLKDFPNRTPKHLIYINQDTNLLDSIGSPFKSPAFRLSDYLTFNKQNEKGDVSPLSINYRSPDFRLSDYIVFKDRFSEDEVTQRIENDLNEGSPSRKSGDYITSDGFLVQRIPAGGQSQIMGTEDDFQNNYFNDTAIDSSFSALVTSSYPILKKRFISNSTNSNPKQSRNVILDVKGSNSPSLKQTNNENGKSHDEDKENKKHKDKKEATKKSTKVKSNARTAALKKVNLSSKRKSKNVNSLKTKSNRLKKEEGSIELNDEPIAIRRGERKRKRKVLMYENEVLEVMTKKRCCRSESPKEGASSKRNASPKPRSTSKRKSKKDWSHVTRLPGSPVRYRCNVCNTSFGHWRGRSGHAACRLGEPPFRCDACDRSFYKRTHFEYHERVHTGEKPYTCKLCSKSFVQKNKLNRHHMAVHKQCTACTVTKEQNEIECDICRKKYNSKDYLKHHIIRVHQENVFKCSKCSKKFSLDANRKRHELSHTTERPFVCDICSNKFKNKYLLTRHKKSHDKKRPFSCEHCGRGFLSKYEVQRHMSAHFDLNTFICALCNSKFRRKDNLKRHMNDHHTQDLHVNTGNSTESDVRRFLISGPCTPPTPMDKRKQVDVEQASKIEKEAKMPQKVRTRKTKKPKKISRTDSITSDKSSSKSSKTNVSSSAVPISFRPTNSKFVFVDDIPREEAILLNQQIELKMRAQKSFCNFPGLTRKIDLCVLNLMNRIHMSKSNSNSNDATGAKQNQEAENSDNSDDEELRQGGVSYVHWRRRTAESLSSV